MVVFVCISPSGLLVLCCTMGFLVEMTATKRVFLLDTTLQKNLSWAKSSNGKAEDGWTEESYTQEGINWRSYVVCDVGSSNVNNWVRTPYIDRGRAKSLYLDITFTMRDCKMFPHTARTCKETFRLLYYESDFDFGNTDMPRLQEGENAFRLIDRVAADEGRFTSIDSTNQNEETFSVPVTKKGVYFAFHDEGGCTSILAVKVYYKVCEERTEAFAWFAETPTGHNQTIIEKTAGVCVPHALPTSNRPELLCNGDGNWQMLNGGCECMAGYTSIEGACVACKKGTFKPAPGFAKCAACPDRSDAPTEGRDTCACDAGYYRAKGDGEGDACTEPPSRPRDVSITSVDHDSVTLRWDVPAQLGGRTDTSYRVDCPDCPSHSTQYRPGQAGLTDRSVTISGLQPGKEYSVRVVSENGVSLQDANLARRTAAVLVETKQLVPYFIRDLHIEPKSGGAELQLTWQPPLVQVTGQSSQYTLVDVPVEDGGLDSNKLLTPEFPGGGQYHTAEVDKYFVRYRKAGQDGAPFYNATSVEPFITLYNLSPDVAYEIQVKAYIARTGYGSWSPAKRSTPSSQITNTHPHGPGDPSSTQAVIVFACLFILLVLFFCVLFLCWRHRKGRGGGCGKDVCGDSKQPSDLDALDSTCKAGYGTPEGFSGGNPSVISNGKCFDPLMGMYGNGPYSAGYKPYVDPLTYEDPSEAIKLFANEIPAECVFIEGVIGAGEFGEVCCGKMDLPDADGAELVAIKTLKPGSSEKAKSDFLAEAAIMGQFQHPHVIRLRGVVTRSEPAMIITAYMPNRSLDTYLKANDGKLNILRLMRMLSGIASGMEYLSGIGYVHRDLAARNVLVDEALDCKIADFGLSRVTEGSCEQAYTTKGGKIPVRWTAPEAISYRKFTTASDVWSFGIVVWEVVSYGERPYWDWTNQDVIQAVEQGYRLPPPMGCPKVVYELMLICWQYDRTARPSFANLLQSFQDFLRCPELLSPPAITPGSEATANFSMPPPPSLSTGSLQSSSAQSTSVYSSTSSGYIHHHYGPGVEVGTSGQHPPPPSSHIVYHHYCSTCPRRPRLPGHLPCNSLSPPSHPQLMSHGHHDHHPSSSDLLDSCCDESATSSCTVDDLLPDGSDFAPHPDVAPASTVPVETLLRSIRMDRHIPALKRAGIETAADVARLSEADLASLGVVLADDQRTILDAVARCVRGTGRGGHSVQHGLIPCHLTNCYRSNEMNFSGQPHRGSLRCVEEATLHPAASAGFPSATGDSYAVSGTLPRRAGCSRHGSDSGFVSSSGYGYQHQLSPSQPMLPHLQNRKTSKPNCNSNSNCNNAPNITSNPNSPSYLPSPVPRSRTNANSQQLLGTSSVVLDVPSRQLVVDGSGSASLVSGGDPARVAKSAPLYGSSNALCGTVSGRPVPDAAADVPSPSSKVRQPGAVKMSPKCPPRRIQSSAHSQSRTSSNAGIAKNTKNTVTISNNNNLGTSNVKNPIGMTAPEGFFV